jgi:ribulose 1,5-bisphosphate carboxylase large subunit-like protein
MNYLLVCPVCVRRIKIPEKDVIIFNHPQNADVVMDKEHGISKVVHKSPYRLIRLDCPSCGTCINVNEMDCKLVPDMYPNKE